MPLRCSCEKLNLVENIVRTARRGKSAAVYRKHSSYTDLFQHIIDEAERLLPPDSRLLNKENTK